MHDMLNSLLAVLASLFAWSILSEMFLRYDIYIHLVEKGNDERTRHATPLPNLRVWNRLVKSSGLSVAALALLMEKVGFVLVDSLN